MARGGTYRIDGEEFPAPVTSWEKQIIGPKLTGLPSLNSYYKHQWQWPAGGLEACDMERLLNLYYAQDATGQLSIIETDSHDADSALEIYGTREYRDFVILDVAPVTREFPEYAGPVVTFEILISSEVGG